MKKYTILFIFAMFVSLQSFAEHERSVSVKIDNEVYFCSKGDSTDQCKELIDAFSQKVTRCLKNYNGPYERTNQCIPAEWASFRKNVDKACIYRASLICFDRCVEYYNGPYESTGQCKGQCNID